MRLGIDIDGVVRDFATAADSKFGAPIQTGEYDLTARYGDAEYVKRLFHGDLVVPVFTDADVIDGAYDLVWLLDRWSVRTGNSWIFVSAQPTALHEALTREWVWRNLSHKADIRFFASQADKWRAADVLLDDNPAALDAFASHGHTAIGFDREYNRGWQGERITQHEEIFNHL